MKIRLVQMNPTPGDLLGNLERMENAIHRAESDGLDLLLFPELALPGYPPQDLLEQPAFCRACERAGETLISQSGSVTVVFGTIERAPTGGRRPLRNVVVAARNGERIETAAKQLLPSYDVFNEERYFEPGERTHWFELQGKRIGLTVCEDLWHNENESGAHAYRGDPVASLAALKPDLVLNLSASPYTKKKHQLRRKVLARRAVELEAPILYCNQVGAQAELLFEGDSMVMLPSGEVFQHLDPFEEGVETLDWDGDQFDGVDPAGEDRSDDEKYRLFRGLVTGIRDYLDKSGASDQLILGLSGGIDSALVAVLAVEAVGPERVTALTLPSGFSSPGSVTDSIDLARELKCTLHELSIQETFDQALHSLAPLFGDLPFNVAEENMQSRIRGLFLMAMANKFGSLLLTTGNKSELATGYATLYGDMNGGLNPIGDLYKRDVYALARWLNDHWFKRTVIPEAILTKAPSAELRPDQTDQDSLPPYDLLDPVLEAYLEGRKDLDEIDRESPLDRNTIRDLLSLVDRNEFKRYQAPPILKVTPRAFGMGRRWPLVQGWSRSRGSIQ